MLGAARRNPKTKSNQMVRFPREGSLGAAPGAVAGARSPWGGLGRGRVRATRLFGKKQKAKKARAKSRFYRALGVWLLPARLRSAAC